MSKQRDCLTTDTCDQQSVVKDLTIQQKNCIVDAFVRSVIFRRISDDTGKKKNRQ